MYYYKTIYKDGTWSYIKELNPITDPKKQVCMNCIKVERKNKLWFYLHAIFYGFNP